MDLSFFYNLVEGGFNWKSFCLSLTLGTILTLTGLVFGMPEMVRAAPISSENWIGAWFAAPIKFMEPGLSYRGFENTSLRQIVHPHIDGSKVRIKLSNFYGIKPVTFNAVHVALQDSGASILQGSDRMVTFKGQSAITIQNGAEVWSDPVDLQVVDNHNLAISFYFAGASGPATYHKRALQKIYIAKGGDHTTDLNGNAYGKIVTAWFWLTGVEVVAEQTVKGTLVTLGDSITDGNGSTIATNRRYPDRLAERIRRESPQNQLAVLNAGISGNQLLADAEGFGVKALDRLEWDVLQQGQLKAVILFEGINDIRNGCHDPQRIIAAMKTIIERIHARGAKVYGGTLTPCAQGNRPDYYNAEVESTRGAVNEWIRTSGAFDGVIDFDKAIRDPQKPLWLLPQYDSGDHLHLSDAGYQAMANAIDLKMILK